MRGLDVQILGLGRDLYVQSVAVPADLAEGLTAENRAEEFIYWATFREVEPQRAPCVRADLGGLIK